jgi:hypothetical protein
LPLWGKSYVCISPIDRVLKTLSRPIRDEDGPMVAKIFYCELLKQDMLDADDVAYALDAAVAAFRGSGEVSPQRWVPFVHIGA